MKNENSRTALLIMDVQAGILDRVADKSGFLERVRTVIDAAHSFRLPVIFVVVGFRPGMPEINERNKMFSGIRNMVDAARGFIDPKPAIEPADGEIVVTKRRVSAFSGSDLEVVLRAKDIRHLVLGGIATSGVVLSTVREAADKDFGLTVLSDLCSDTDQDVHSLLLNRVFPRQADVMTSEEWIGSLRSWPRNVKLAGQQPRL
jgi:nicotinamidase-related amidase